MLSRRGESLSMSHTDRFLISVDLEETFPNLGQVCFIRLGSDHILMIMDSGGLCKGEISFRFKICG